MRQPAIFLAVCVLQLTAFSTGVQALAQEQPTLDKALPNSLDEFRWLLAKWEFVGKRTTVSETWKAVGDNVFQGQGVTSSNEEAQGEQEHKPLATEALLLVVMEGKVFYFAKPQQNAMPVAFALTQAGPRHAVFENKEHDFPQKIEYTLSADGRHLKAVASNAERKFELQLERSSLEFSSRSKSVPAPAQASGNK